MNKRLSLWFIVIIGLTFMVACNSAVDETRQSEIDSIEEDDEASTTSLPDAKESPRDTDSTADDREQSISSDEAETVKQSNRSRNSDEKQQETAVVTTGIFIGQADPHTIEIETEEATEGWAAYQLTMEARDIVVDLEPGDKVSYKYYKDGEMLVIEHIEKVN